LIAVIRPGLDGIVLPKVESAVAALSRQQACDKKGRKGSQVSRCCDGV
jgi:hypothetical protein